MHDCEAVEIEHTRGIIPGESALICIPSERTEFEPLCSDANSLPTSFRFNSQDKNIGKYIDFVVYTHTHKFQGRPNLNPRATASILFRFENLASRGALPRKVILALLSRRFPQYYITNCFTVPRHGLPSYCRVSIALLSELPLGS